MDGTLSIVSRDLLGRTTSVSTACKNALNFWITRTGTIELVLSALLLAARSKVALCPVDKSRFVGRRVDAVFGVFVCWLCAYSRCPQVQSTHFTAFARVQSQIWYVTSHTWEQGFVVQGLILMHGSLGRLQVCLTNRFVALSFCVASFASSGHVWAQRHSLLLQMWRFCVP
jgi:hypothetical protein